MGSSMAKGQELQRTAQKNFTDPRTWDKVKMMTDTKMRIPAGTTSQNIHGSDSVLKSLANQQSHIDADEYYAKMKKIEDEHMEKSSLKPGEVTNALRSELYQQRQYLSYKDTMQRLGVPESSILSIDKWEEKHKEPISMDLKDAIMTLTDREASCEKIEGAAKDPSHHDLFSNIEDGDNRFSERMLNELISLKSEGKLCPETAGRE
eukprot:TRINITY_DN8715_c0_g1_i2.p1 TRINITY_DN8715_c0_g1~~TRINITY_DN8715_c0_g1_i2.p1  ORF type:complete len:227 (+),score=23.20 TRINITY_DN8715_c0_g1_i2:66-683(+)